MGGLVGFNYGTCEFIFKALGIPETYYEVTLVKLNAACQAAITIWNAKETAKPRSKK